MPLSGDAHKMAKISNPWRAQFFLGTLQNGPAFFIHNAVNIYHILCLTAYNIYHPNISEHFLQCPLGDGEGFYRGDVYETWGLHDLRSYVTTAMIDTCAHSIVPATFLPRELQMNQTRSKDSAAPEYL